MEVLHPALDVTDAEAMRGFYGELLGLEEHRSVEIDGVDNVWFGGAGPAELQFRVVDDMESPRGVHHIAIASGDLEETVERAVEEWNSTIEVEPRVVGDGETRIAFISDPFGYSVELIES